MKAENVPGFYRALRLFAALLQDPALADAVWAAGARAVGWGSSDAHERAKDLVFAGAPEAIEAMRTSAVGPSEPR